METNDVLGTAEPLEPAQAAGPEEPAESATPVNRRAGRALTFSWVPGFGIIAGRKALKEIKWTGEQGRDKAVRAIVVNSVVTAVLAAGLIALNLTSNSGTPQMTLLHLDSGQCYENTDKVVVDRKVYARLQVVRKVACGQPHWGEVIGQWDAGAARRDHPTDDVLQDRLAAECRKQLAGYGADLWRLPENAKLQTLYLRDPSVLGGGGSPAVCFLESDGTAKLRAPLRQDPSTRTSAQTAYLTAENTYELALWSKPEGDNALIDPTGWKRYASGMAEEARREQSALGAVAWPGAAGAPVAAMKADAVAAAADWERAAAAVDPGLIDHYCAAAEADTPDSAARAARQALGLAAGAPPSLT
jgi:Septum formation